MSGEIIIGAPKTTEEKHDKVYDLVQLFTISQEILGEKVEIKRQSNGDGTILKVKRNDRYDYLEVKYGDDFLQMNVMFTLHKGVDDKLITQIEKLAEQDKDDWDRFFIEEENHIYGAILVGFEQFEEMFPKMYSHSSF